MKKYGFLFAFTLLLFTSQAAAQTCVQADLTHPDSVSIAWQDNSTDESGFSLERKLDAGAFIVIAAAIPANTTSYTDSTVTRGSVARTYTYRLQGYRLSDNSKSAFTPEACIVFAPTLPPPLAAPGGFTVATISSSSFRVTWEDLPNEAGYELQGKLARGNDTFARVATLPANTATYDWTGRKRYTPYCMRLAGITDPSAPELVFTPIVCATTSK